MSREALSLEISQVVSRVVSGEEIDVAEQSVMLALKYPDLGMSGEMIGEAIVRAANMVGMIKSAPAPIAWPEEPASGRPGDKAAPPHANGGATLSPRVDESESSIGDELALAIDTEIGGLIADRAATQSAGRPEDASQPAAAPEIRKPRRSGAVAALRSLFRS